MDPKKEDSLESLLKFDSLESAEQTLLEMHRRYCEFRSGMDREGMACCRAIILKGKKRAVMISKNKKVHTSKREEKAEIAQWFTVWLQTPDVFADWLSLRKESPDFQRRFRPGTETYSP